MQKMTIKPHHHLLKFLYQSEVEAPETVAAVQGYLKEYHWWLFVYKIYGHHYMLALHTIIIIYLHHLQNSLTVNAFLVSV